MSNTAKPSATVLRSTVEKTYLLKLEGCDPRPMPYSRQGRHYRPLSMTVTRENGKVSMVLLSGVTIKKDGSDGQQSATERLWIVRQDEWPAWVKSIVGGLA